MTLPTSLFAARDTLRTWLTRDALPLWWDTGADRSEGGFFDTLDLHGRAMAGPRRARVQARQIVCYALAAARGWTPHGPEAMRHGWAQISGRHRRADGLFGALGGTEAESRVDLYDQAFVLLALAYLHHADEPGARAEAERLIGRLAPHPAGGFHGLAGAPLASNPTMHLFEAVLAWMDLEGEGPWSAIAAGLARLAMQRLIDPQTGALGEVFEADWRRPGDATRQRVEPGHQFEWAWLLMRWHGHAADPEALAAARRLIEMAERTGVDADRGVAINALDGALRPVDRAARLWPQTERLKATLLASRLGATPPLWDKADQTARALLRYLDTPRPGLWRDRMAPDGSFDADPVKASSFYHIVGAIVELDETLG